VTEHDYQLEQDLRAEAQEARDTRIREAALALADFDEQQGHDYRRAQDLRAEAREARNARIRETALVLADFYEQQGQPSRAALWRVRRNPLRKDPPDLVAWDLKQRRKTVLWLLSHVVSKTHAARLFQSRPKMIRQVERAICEAANEERHNPTMAATLRLQAARALPQRFDRGSFELGTEPPDDWPNTRRSISASRRR
jgi:hypothetical protein